MAYLLPFVTPLTRRLRFYKFHIHNVVAVPYHNSVYIRRSFTSFLPNIKCRPYIALIRHKLDYASSIWHPHQFLLNNLIGSIQNRAALFTLYNYSSFSVISAMKSSPHLPELCFHQLPSRQSLVYKVYYTSSLYQSLILPPSYISQRSCL